MKILISVQYFYPPVGGAEYSLITLANELSKNHEVFVIQPGHNNVFKKIGQIKVLTQKIPLRYILMWYDILKSPKFIFHTSPVIFQAAYWKKILEDKISEINPDLIITQLNFAAPSVDIAVKYNIPSIMFIRSYEHFCPISYINGTVCNRLCNNCVSLQNKIHYMYINKWLKWNLNAIRNSSLVVANSKFTAKITTEVCSVEPLVLYPTIDTNKYKCRSDSREFITIINPTKSKGVDIFLNIAERLPTHKFITVGGSKNLFNDIINKNLNNIIFLEKTNNIVDIYAKTKILLAPVIWPEPFGRVVIEAGVSGIPSIASNVGGLPESVENGGILIDDVYNIDEWVKAIRSLDNTLLYNELSKNAKNHADKFDHLSQYNSFVKLTKNKLNINI